MKKTKFITFFCCVLAVFCCFGLTSCENNEDEYKQEIVGKWWLYSALTYDGGLIIRDMTENCTVEFTSDKRYVGRIAATDLANKGKWSIDGNTLTLKDDNKKSASFTLNIKDNSLKMTTTEVVLGHSYKTEIIYDKE